MHAYEISKNEGEPSIYAGDLRAVRAVIRSIPRAGRDWARVQLVAIPHDKAAILQLLNGRPPITTVLRRWRPSARGRLIEIGPDDD
jgi:hypothetical protein